MIGSYAVSRVARATWTFGGLGLWAQNQPSSPINVDPAQVVNYGALGIIVFAFFTDRIVTKKALDRAIAERDKAEEARDAVIKQQFEKVIPLLELISARLIPLMDKLSDKLPPEDGA